MLLYIHVPFCRSKCAYCAFHSVVPRPGDSARWAQGVRREAEHWGRALKRPEVTSVYFGGGTPSLVQLPLMQSVMAAIRNNFALSPDVECTLEANPDSMLDMNHLHGLLRMGVNRLSVGIQSLNDSYLHTLGRRHTADEARAAVRLARDIGFANISLDLIWGLPKQRLYTWMRDLREVVSMHPEHLSCYGLSIEPGTRLERMAREVDLETAPDDDLAKMYVYGAEYLESEGYLQYEISNFARMGFQSRHNQGYWEGTPYLGLGPAAVSTIGSRRWKNPDDMAAWEAGLDAGAPGAEHEDLDLATRTRELVMLRLRTSRGLKLSAYRALTGRSFTDEFKPMIHALRQNDLIRISGGYLRLSRTGMLVSDAILANLFSDG